MKADDRGHVQRSRENRRVIRAAAGVGGKAAHLRPIELRGERGRQLVGDEHGRFVELAEQIARSRHVLAEVHLQAADQIGDVAFALAQIRIGDLVEYAAEILEHLLDRPLGVDALRAHDLGGARNEQGIVEHQELRVEERRQLRAAPPRHARANVGELLARPLPALLEPRDLARDAPDRDVMPQHPGALNQDDRAARHDAGRDADARQALHGSSPKPEATSAARAATASRSSAPSALMVIVEPRAAASSRIPMMLFPSISRASRATRTCDSNRVARWTNFAAARACMPS